MPEIVHWNPHRRLAARGVLWRIKRPDRINNFGDLLGPWIVARMRAVLGLGRAVSAEQRLLTVGSIINPYAREGDTVWGSGIHGNRLPLEKPIPALDIRAVRGPLTARILRESDNSVPEVFGDPGLLIPHLWTDTELGIHRRSGGTVVVPNYHDLPFAPTGSLNPRGNMLDCVRRIASANRVIASSLHGVIVAEAYGVPATLVASATEQLFKYEDYYRGTGRELPTVARGWREGFIASPTDPLDTWDPTDLLESFPRDLWRA